MAFLTGLTLFLASLDQCACQTSWQATNARAIPTAGADSGEARRLIPPSSDDPAAAYTTYITYITSTVAKK